MNIHLHIERVIVDGLPLSAAQARALRAEIEAQLTESLAGFRARDGYAVASLSAASIALPHAPTGQDAGSAIARSLHATLAASSHAPHTNLLNRNSAVSSHTYARR